MNDKEQQQDHIFIKGSLWDFPDWKLEECYLTLGSGIFFITYDLFSHVI